MLINKNKGQSLLSTFLLIIGSFLLVLYSTFLTRSGILGNSSVHAFTDLGMSGQLLIYLSFFVLIATYLLIINFKNFPKEQQEERDLAEPQLTRLLSRLMNLTEAQKEALNELDMQRGEFFRSMPRGNGGPGTEDFEKRMQDMQAKMKEFENQATAILTPEQKTIWEERKAEIKVEQEAGRNDRPDINRPRSDAGSSPSAATQPSTRRTVFSDEKAPDGVAPTASFAARPIPGSTGTTITDDGVGSAVGAKAANGEATLSFNFRYAPWTDVLKLFGKYYGTALASYPAVVSVIKDALHTHETVHRAELQILHADTPMVLGYSTLQVKNRQGEYLGIGLIFQDLTVVKKK